MESVNKLANNDGATVKHLVSRCSNTINAYERQSVKLEE